MYRWLYAYIGLAVPVCRWRPVMQRPVMPTDIMASSETLNIQHSVTIESKVQKHEILHFPWPLRVGSRSQSPLCESTFVDTYAQTPLQANNLSHRP